MSIKDFFPSATFLSSIFQCFDKIFGDPDAADIVFTSGADILAIGINVTHQVVLTGKPTRETFRKVIV